MPEKQLTYLLIACAIAIGLLIYLLVMSVKRSSQLKKQLQAQRKETNLLQNELKKTEQLAEELSGEKATLLSIVSHDLKSPFNRAFALVNLLKMSEAKFNDEQKEYLGKMHQVIKDGMWLIRNLLDMRSIERNSIEPDLVEIDLVRFTKSTLKNIKPLADIKSIRFKVESTDEKIVVKSDKQYLMRVLENVVSNSMKFSDRGSLVTIALEARQTKAVIAVADEGDGIPDEEHDKLFKKYQPLRAKPTDGESATGLGLFVVKSLLEKMGGTITYKRKGKGSCFEIVLPA